MKHPVMRIWRDFRFPLLIAFAYLPVPFLMLANFAPQILPFVWLWPLSYVLLDALGTKIRGKWRILYGIAAIIALVVLTLFMAGIAQELRICLVPILYIAALIIGMPLSPAGRNELISPAWYITGVAVQLIAQAFLYSAQILDNPVLKPVTPWILLSFFLFVAIGLISLNQSNLSFAARGRQAASRAMQRKNLLMTLVFFAIALGITFIPNLVSSLSAFFLWLIHFIADLLRTKAIDVPVTGVQDPVGERPSFVEFEDAKRLPPVLNTIITVIGLIIVAVVLFFAIRYLIRKLIALAKRLKHLLTQYIHVASEDYVDIISDTREDNDRSERKPKKEKKLSFTEERRLTPTQQIRYRYSQLMRKHPEWDSGSTARENLNGTAASVYERVRYSQYTASEEDARSFAAETKKV